MVVLQSGKYNSMVNIIEYYHIVRLSGDDDLNISALASSLGVSKLDALSKLRYAEKHFHKCDTLEVPVGYRYYKSILDLSFGQFLSVETMLCSSATHEAKMLHLLTTILRPEGEVLFDNGDEVGEDKHKLEILKIPFWSLTKLLSDFLENRHKFHFIEYKDVFYDSETEQVNVDDEEDDKEGGSERSLDFERKWYWVSILDTLADSNALNWESSLNLGMTTAAPFIAYRVSKAKREWVEAKAREQEMKAKSRR